MSHAAMPLSGAAPTVPDDSAMSLTFLTDMLRIRRMEEKSAELYGGGKIRGFLHLSIGEEAVAVGALHALEPQDNIVATYREHGHALVRGVSMNAIMAELFGKRDGCSGGRGGSMHLFDRATRFYGGNAIVGGGLPLAVGLALADKLQKTPRVTACFFGEGAVAEGAFHESMNLASLWELPVLFLCENNLYAMGTALARSQSQTDLCIKASSYKMPSVKADGMDVMAVHGATRQAALHARSGKGPCFVEFQTYRYRGHSMFDPDLYRDKAELEQWKARGPIHTFSARLKAQGQLSEAQFLAIDAQVAREVQAAVDFAEASGWEPLETLLQDVYSPQVPP